MVELAYLLEMFLLTIGTCGGIGPPLGTDLVKDSGCLAELAYHLELFFLRIGTCGGIGLPPGTVVVTDEAYDGLLRPVLDTVSAYLCANFRTLCP